MDIKNILAATLNFNFDYDKIKNEILDTAKFWDYSPPYNFNLEAAKAGKIFLAESVENYNRIDFQDMGCQITKKNLQGQYIFYMRYHIDNVHNNSRFNLTKKLSADGWRWRNEIIEKTPYLKFCIENLPYEHIGCIRVFITENTFFPTHRDYGWG